MSTPSQAIPELSQDARTEISAMQKYVWSLKRELWEYKSVWIAPMALAGVYLFAFLVSTIGGAASPGLQLHPAQGVEKLAQPFFLAAGLMMAVTFVVGIYYASDALYGERRDRSVLFWKSLPVSDTISVFAKATIPIVVLPALALVLALAMQLLMIVISSAGLLMRSQDAAAIWRALPFGQMSAGLTLHLLMGHGLYYAPIFAYLLLVSAWAKRAPLLWAVLPPIALVAAERIAFNTAYVAQMLGDRLGASGSGNFDVVPKEHEGHAIVHIGLGAFLSEPGLWIGLAIGAACLYGAIRLRRAQQAG
jgi:ABC-2 type transport system permease protein